MRPPEGKDGTRYAKVHEPLSCTADELGIEPCRYSRRLDDVDIGCGGGATLQRLLKRSQDAKIYGIDISEESVAKARQINADVLDKQVFVQQGSAEKLPYEDEMFDLVTAVETVYFWPNLPSCMQEVRRVLKPGGRFAIMVEVVDTDSKWTNVVEGMTAYTPEQLKTLLDDAGFTQTEIHCKKPSYATILGVKP